MNVGGEIFTMLTFQLNEHAIIFTLATDSRSVRHGGRPNSLSGTVGREHEHRALPGAAAVQQPDERHKVVPSQYPESGEGARCHERRIRGKSS